MTEKRFTIEKDVGLYRIFDNGKLVPVLDGQPICDLLNELNCNQCLYTTSTERNNFHNKTLEYVKQMGELKEENEELREQNLKITNRIKELELQRAILCNNGDVE